VTTISESEIEKKFENLGYGVTIKDLVFTQETIMDFKDARKGYSQAGQLISDKDGILEISNVQTVKGTPRKSLVVIDLKDCRAVYCL